MQKLFSGRYFLTVVAGIVFAYAVYAKLLDAQATSAIISMVFISYFQRTDRLTNKGEVK